jgi:cell wall-associated NlpC family hydrolase
VYSAAGIVGPIEVPHYPHDWFLHQGAERYMEGLMQYARPIEGPPQPADVALFRFGRCYAHGAIVVEWPRLIHAYWSSGVVWGSADLAPLRGHPVRFFSPFAEA